MLQPMCSSLGTFVWWYKETTLKYNDTWEMQVNLCLFVVIVKMQVKKKKHVPEVVKKMP